VLAAVAAAEALSGEPPAAGVPAVGATRSGG
jgi:hypothetical protein